jgi:hypothetical protein
LGIILFGLDRPEHEKTSVSHRERELPPVSRRNRCSGHGGIRYAGFCNHSKEVHHLLRRCVPAVERLEPKILQLRRLLRGHRTRSYRADRPDCCLRSYRGDGSRKSAPAAAQAVNNTRSEIDRVGIDRTDHDNPFQTGDGLLSLSKRCLLCLGVNPHRVVVRLRKNATGCSKPDAMRAGVNNVGVVEDTASMFSHFADEFDWVPHWHESNSRTAYAQLERALSRQGILWSSGAWKSKRRPTRDG